MRGVVGEPERRKAALQIVPIEFEIVAERVERIVRVAQFHIQKTLQHGAVGRELHTVTSLCSVRSADSACGYVYYTTFGEKMQRGDSAVRLTFPAA